MSRKKSHLEGKDLKKIGERFELLRDHLDLKQANFAKLLGMAPNSYSDIKRGIKGPIMPVLLLLEHRYGISPHQILTGEGFSLDNLQSSRLPDGVREVEALYTDRTVQFLDILQKILNDVDDLKRRVRDLEVQINIDDLAGPAGDALKR